MNKNELKKEFLEVLEEHQKCYKESKKLNINCYFCGNRNSLIDDFTEAYENDDYKLMNKIIGAMICNIKSYKLVKSNKKSRR